MDKNYEEIEGILIITPQNYDKSLIDCPCCGYALRHKEDLIEIKKNQCCVDCSMHFYYPYRKKWEEGWRPTRKEARSVIISNKSGEANVIN